MSIEAPEFRLCICGTLVDIDYFLAEQFATCLCGQTLTIRTTPLPDTWFIQHGPNPEHRSPDYPAGGPLVAACDWIDAVCLDRRRAAQEGEKSHG